MQIVHALGIPKNSYGSIRSCLRGCFASYMKNEPYDPNREKRAAILSIPIKSLEAEIIACCMEESYTIDDTVIVVNVYRMGAGKDAVGRSAVYITYLALKPLRTARLIGKQGSSDEGSAWSKARFRWVTQLLLRRGLLSTADADFPKEWEALGCFNHLPSLSTSQIVHFDECHRKTVIGDTRPQVRMPRDAHGDLDPNGTYDEKRFTVTKVKYATEIRFLLGVAKCEFRGAIRGRSTFVGKRCALFDYTGCWVRGIGEYKKLVTELYQGREIPELGLRQAHSC